MSEEQAMTTTGAHDPAATTRQRDMKAHTRRTSAEDARERLLTGLPVTECAAQRPRPAAASPGRRP
jgi:hypothetical protein